MEVGDVARTSSDDQQKIHVKFITKDTRYSIAATPYLIPLSSDDEKLNLLINQLLGLEEEGVVAFDFLIGESLLRSTIQEFLSEKNISSETQIDIEYFVKSPEPEPENALLQDDWISCLAARSGDWVFSGSYDNSVSLWKLSTASVVIKADMHKSAVKCIDCRDETVVSGSHDESLLLWRCGDSNNELTPLAVCKGHAGSVDAVKISESGRFASGGWDGMLKIWSENVEESVEDSAPPSSKAKRKKISDKLPVHVPLLTLSGHKEGISTLHWIDSDTIVTGSWDHRINIWDMTEGKVKAEFATAKTILSSDISIAGPSQSRLLLIGSADRIARVYDLRLKDDESSIISSSSNHSSHYGWISSVRWSPSNERHFLTASYDKTAKIWDTRSPTVPLYNLTGHTDKLLSCDWSNADKIITGSADSTIKIYKYASKTTLKEE